MTHCTHTILIAQLVISGMMATLMTGIFGFPKLAQPPPFCSNGAQAL